MLSESMSVWVGGWVYHHVCVCTRLPPCFLWPASNGSLNNRTTHNYSPPCIQEQMAHTDPEMALSVKLSSYCICLLASVWAGVGAAGLMVECLVFVPLVPSLTQRKCAYTCPLRTVSGDEGDLNKTRIKHVISLQSIWCWRHVKDFPTVQAACAKGWGLLSVMTFQFPN